MKTTHGQSIDLGWKALLSPPFLVLTALLLLLLIIAPLSAAAQAPPVSTQVTLKTGTGGAPVTQTTVQNSGNLTTVSTSTVSGQNAFNYFSVFNVAGGSTVDLLLPSNTANLLNLVDNQANIWGTVNSLLASKQIGGNVFFLDPAGLVLGSSGVMNVGALTILTPTQAWMNQFTANMPGGATYVEVNPGGVPLAPGSLISIAGTVNSTGNVILNGGTVNVPGVVNTGASFTGSDPNFSAGFSNVVNTGNISNAQSITVNGGTVSIGGGLNSNGANIYLNSSDGDVSVGTVNAGGGDISIAAQGGSIDEANAVGILSLNGHTLTLSATGGMGSLAAPLNLKAFVVNANAGSDVNFEVDNGSLQIGAVSTPGNVYFNVPYRSIVQYPGGAGVTADNVTFNSGSVVGSDFNPLLVNASGVVNAAAPLSIALDAPQGDLMIGTLSTPQTVTLAAAGSIFQGAGNGIVSGNATLSAGNNIGNLSNPLGLTVNGTVSANAGQNVFLDPVTNLTVGTLASNGDVHLISSGGSILQGSGLGISAVNLFLTAPNGGIGLSSTPLLVNLNGSLNASAGAAVNVNAPTGDLLIGAIATPSDVNLQAAAGSILQGSGAGIAANNLSLNAANAIGSDNTALNFVASGLVNAAASQAINLNAASGDFTVGAITTASDSTLNAASGSILQGNGTGLSANNLNLSAANGIGSTTTALNLTALGVVNAAAGQTINLNAGSGDLNAGTIATGDDVTLNAATGSVWQSAGGVVIGNNLSFSAANNVGSLAAPMSVLSGGQLNAAAGQDINVAAFAGDLNIATVATSGNVNLSTATGSLLQASGGSGVIGNNLTLGAALGIGTSDAPLQTFTGGLVNANADLGININAFVGDFQVGTISTPSDVSLTAATGSILQGAGTGISANNLTLNAASGIGSLTLPLSIVTTGTLNAAANTPIYIDALTGDVTIGTVSSLFDVNLGANSGSIFQGAGSGVNANNIVFTAPLGALGTSATPLDVQAAGLVSGAAAHDIDITAPTGSLGVDTIISTAGNITLNAPAGNIVLGVVSAPGIVTLDAGGSILDPAPLISAGQAQLTAQTGSIGTSTGPIDLAVTGNVNAGAQQNVNLVQTAGNLNAVQLQSQAGSVNLQVVNGSANVQQIQAPVSVNVNTQGSQLNIGSIGQTQSASLQSSGGLNVGQVSVSSSLSAAASSIELAQVTDSNASVLSPLSLNISTTGSAAIGLNANAVYFSQFNAASASLTGSTAGASYPGTSLPGSGQVVLDWQRLFQRSSCGQLQSKCTVPPVAFLKILEAPEIAAGADSICSKDCTWPRKNP